MNRFKLNSMVAAALLGLLACATPNSPAATESGAASSRTATPGEDAPAPSAAWLTQIDRGAEALSAGALEVDAERFEGAPQFLELASLSAEVETVGPMARYEITHRFENPTDQVLEGTFRFPLPAGAVVTGLAMEIDGELMEGEILERDRAREIYEEIVDSMRDPALLEWEAGQTFKLRVFPIEPGEQKRVVLRYMAPLAPDDRSASGFAVLVPTATPAMQRSIPKLEVRVDGEAQVIAEDHDPRQNLRVGLATASTPGYVQELDGETRYFAARVDLDWAELPAPTKAPKSRRTVIVVDSSRSALESWELAREAVRSIIAGLDEGEEVLVLAADLEARAFAEGFVHKGEDTAARADEFLAAIEPDGASDLGAALDRVGAALAEASEAELDQVVYVGDGTPTWGSTDPATLVAKAEGALDGAALHVLSLGERESRGLLESLCGATGGRAVRPQSSEQVRAFAGFLREAPKARRVAEVELEIPGVDKDRLHTPARKTWFEGERPVVHFALAADAPAPQRLILRGRSGAEHIERTLELGEARDLGGVRQQWAAREIAAATEAQDKPRAVELSVEHSVLSRYTAMLVLESEEAYERYQIDRRNGPKTKAKTEGEGDPQISGRDLDGDASAPYLGPGDLQPGDPEIHIPAPRDARSVEVVFPFGESKRARWEQGLGQWTVRFLVDDDTAPGRYEVLVRITHADGRVELLTLDYTIDVQAPALELELRPCADEPGAYEVIARQRLVEADAARERPEGMASGDGDEEPRTLDAKRVELLMPDGQTLHLARGVRGSFARRWKPKTAIDWPATATAVVADRALNYQRLELPLERPEEDGAR